MNPTNPSLKKDLLPEIREVEAKLEKLNKQLDALEAEHSQTIFKLGELKKLNAANVSIPLKDSIKWCMEVDSHNPAFFIKTPSLISNCVAWKHGVEASRELKNKIATTLSTMHNQKQIGKIIHNGKAYYGMTKFFNEDLISLTPENVHWLEDLSSTN